MPLDPKKRQQKALKRRRRQKEAAKRGRQGAMGFSSARAMLRVARNFPILECLIGDDWQGNPLNLARIIVARQQPDTSVAFGSFLVDMACLGVKDTFANADVPLSEYRGEFMPLVEQMGPLSPCPPDLAHQIIYQSIDYAARFGFKPQKDYKWSQLVLEPRGTLPEPYDLTFGVDGKPCYVPGPADNVAAILAKLERTAGPGNYDFRNPFDLSSDLSSDWDELDLLDDGAEPDDDY